MRRTGKALCVTFAFAMSPLAACLTNPVVPEIDAGEDSGLDAGHDAADAAPKPVHDAAPDSTVVDAGTDAEKTPDAAPDARPDAEADATPDAPPADSGPDAEPDAFVDAGIDAEPDAAIDAALDTSVQDAGEDTDSGGGPISCADGSTLCDGGCVDLTSNVDNCGACGAVCSGGVAAACLPNGCLITVANEQSSPSALLVDSTRVYWVNEGGDAGSVAYARTTGGGATTLISGSNGRYVPTLTTDTENVYYADPLGIYGIPLDGGAVTTIATTQTYFDSLQTVTSLEVSSGQLYYLGGTVVSMASYVDEDLAYAYTLDGGSTNEIGNYGPIAANSTAFAGNATTIFAEGDDGGVIGIPESTAVPYNVASNANPTSIVLDSTRAYWTSADNGAVWSALLDGGSPVRLSGTESSPLGITVDSENVYWTNNLTSGSIVMAAKGGDAGPTTLVSGQDDPYGVAVNDAGIYWTNSGNGTVMWFIPR